MKHLLPFLFFLICCTSAAWAHQVRGIVTDADGEAIPYAKVYEEKTTNGVVTNVKGEYYLDLPNGSHRLVFSSLGYASKTVEVLVSGKPVVLDVTLGDESVEIETVTLTAGRKDPAYAIMEKVIANKKEYIQQFQSYQCETYLKASLEVDTLVRKRVSEVADSMAAANAGPKPDSMAMQDNGSVVIGDKFFAKMADKKAIRIEKRERKKAIRDSLNTPPHLASLKDGSQDSVVARKKRASLAKREKNERPKLNLIESQSTTYYEYANKYKSVVHAYRDFSEKRSSSGVNISVQGDNSDRYQTETNNPYLFFLDVSDADFNFYHNLISVPKLADQPFVSPLSSISWNLSYKYHLEETFMEGGYVIHRITVTPRNNEGPFFQGELFIEDGSWAIKSVNFQILPTNLNYFNYFQVIHNYERTGDGRWTKAREDYYYNVKDGKVRYYGNTIAQHTNYQLDPVQPKNFFRNELRRVEQEAFERDSAYWEEIRPFALKEAELEFIRYQDSVYKVRHSDAYLHEQDSIYNHLSIWDILLQGIGFRFRKAGMAFNFSPVIQQINPFGVGGYRHYLFGDISKTWTKYNRLSLSGDVSYGVKSNVVKGGGRLSYTYNPKHFASAYIKAGDRYSTVNQNTTITTIFSRSNFIQRTYVGAGHEMEVFNGLFLNVDAEIADRQSIADLKLEQWSSELFGSSNTPKEFDKFREAIFTFRIKWTPGQKFYTEPYRKVIVGSKYPVFELEYKKSMPGVFQSKMNFDRLKLTVSDEMRLGTMGISRWALLAGAYVQKNNLRFTDYFFFRGSDPFFFANPIQNLQNLDTTLSTIDPYIQANYLHDFGSALSNKIPVLKHTPLQFTAGGGMIYIPTTGFLHTEVYGGLALPFRVERQRFKLGAYYVVSYGNYGQAIGSQLKFGFTFYDSNKNRWTY